MRSLRMGVCLCTVAVLAAACGSSDSGDDPADLTVTLDLSDVQIDDLTDVRQGEVPIEDVEREIPEIVEEVVEDAGVDEPDVDLGVDLGEPDAEIEEEIVECVPDCTDRTCGPDLACGESCGRCTDPDFPACNGGTCEATCSDVACSSLTYCVPEECEPDCAGEDCTAEELCSTDGLETCYVYACSDDRTSCDFDIELGDSCTRETADDVVSESSLGACVGANACSADGSQDILATVCVEGAPTSDPVAVDTQSCELSPIDGAVLSVDQGTCRYPDDVCAIQGTRTEVTTRCDGSGGTYTGSEDIQDELCVRSVDTETVLDEQTDSCGGFDDVCDVTGAAQRTRTYCDGFGGRTNPVDTVACEREVATSTPSGQADSYGSCEYDNVCAVDGVRDVTKYYCNGSGGTRSEVTQNVPSDVCDREVSTSTSTGQEDAYGSCEYESCAVTGVRDVTSTYCDGSGGTRTEVTQNVSTPVCDREVSTSTPSGQADSYGSCEYDNVCSVDGVRDVTKYYCNGSGGTRSEVTQNVSTPVCDREVSTSTPSGQGDSYGSCEYAGVCAVTGVRDVTSYYCDGSGGTRSAVTENVSTPVCNREVSASTPSGQSDSYGSCEYDNVCAVEGVRDVTSYYCNGSGGTRSEVTQNVSTPVCDREVSTSTPSGQGDSYGSCEYDNVCAVEGVRDVTRYYCNGSGGTRTVVTDNVSTPVCDREVSTSTPSGQSDSYGSCEYDNVCAVDGVRDVTKYYCNGSGGTRSEVTQNVSTPVCDREVSTSTPSGQSDSYGSCEYDNVCAVDGVRDVTKYYCNGSGGTRSEVTQNVSTPVCDRTVSTSTPSGQNPSYGSCEYASVCSVTGVRDVVRYYCDGSGGTRSVTSNNEASASCNRTVSTSTPTGQSDTYGSCEYTNVCAVTGVRDVTSYYCDGSGGTRTVTTDNVSTSACNRSVSVNTPSGQSPTYGDCEYNHQCSVSGYWDVIRYYCNGSGGTRSVTSNNESTASCNRSVNTSDPISIETGSCGGFSTDCDETGSRTDRYTYCNGTGGTTTSDQQVSCTVDKEGKDCRYDNIVGLCQDARCCETYVRNIDLPVATDVTVGLVGSSTTVIEDNNLWVGQEGSTQYFAALRFDTRGVTDADDIHSMRFCISSASGVSTNTTVTVHPISCVLSTWSDTTFPWRSLRTGCTVVTSTQLAKLTWEVRTSGMRCATLNGATMSQLANSGIAVWPTGANITLLDEFKANGEAEPHIELSYGYCE